jgi:hypothetical protein
MPQRGADAAPGRVDPKSNALGGTMTLRDLASYKGEWVTPASTSYHDDFGTLEQPGQTATIGAGLTQWRQSGLGRLGRHDALLANGPLARLYWRIPRRTRLLADAGEVVGSGIKTQCPILREGAAEDGSCPRRRSPLRLGRARSSSPSQPQSYSPAVNEMSRRPVRKSQAVSPGRVGHWGQWRHPAHGGGRRH